MTCYSGRDELEKIKMPLSKPRFIKKVDAKFLRTVKKNNLITRKDKVLVACSGGKDSMTLLRLMTKYYKKQTTALHVDLGIVGASSPSLRAVKRYCASWNVPLIVASFKKEFKKGLDEMLAKTRINPCYLDGVLRRYLINKTARQHGFTKLATGHNLDDEAQSVLMNLFMGDLKRQSRLGYSTGVVLHDKFVQRIKPLRDIYESETKLYVKIEGMRIYACNCPYGADSFRRQVRRLLDDYEQKNPGAKEKLIKFYDKRILPRLKSSKMVPLNECEECGEPSSQKPCKTCQLIKMLK